MPSGDPTGLPSTRRQDRDDDARTGLLSATGCRRCLLAAMIEISKVRFDALASYCRHPAVSLVAKELRWLATSDERILATLLLDTDDQFSAVILARDLMERYRWISMTGYFDAPDDALVDLEGRVQTLAPTLDAEREQGDEVGKPVDFFTPVRPAESLNPSFVRLVTEEGFSPAHGIIEPMMRWYEDADGNFVEQFQTTGFDARIWELYMFAALSEVGYRIDRSLSVPDFIAEGLLGQIAVEATTVHPTLDGTGTVVPTPPTDTPEQLQAYMYEYLPIRYAGPLTAKLAKRYWEQPHVSGRPIVFAIQDFHDQGSMTWSRTGLPTYLYGYLHHPKHEDDGSLTIVPEKVRTHRWGSKQIQSGFFNLPDAENVSAVFFNSSGTISKFNRIGVVAGFGSPRVRLVRSGLVVDLDPNASIPKPFSVAVDEAYSESWIEGTDIYHNPRARNPIDPGMIPGAAHHRLLSDGTVETVAPAWQPLTSLTSITIDESDST